jgi:hypothetical protein
MILPIKITLGELSKNGKAHKWDKCYCQHCHRNMWGHGWVARYFSTFTAVIYLKRYRCPGCLIVVTTRPEGYWPRIRSSILAIFEALQSKLNHRFWPQGFPRQRGGHWLKKFVSLAKMKMQTNLSLFLNLCHSKLLFFFP